MSLFIKIISLYNLLYNLINFLAILYLTSIAKLLVEVGTKHSHQILLRFNKFNLLCALLFFSEFMEKFPPCLHVAVLQRIMEYFDEKENIWPIVRKGNFQFTCIQYYPCSVSFQILDCECNWRLAVHTLTLHHIASVRESYFSMLSWFSLQ